MNYFSLFFLFAAFSVNAQTKIEYSKVELRNAFGENQIVFGSHTKPKDNAFKAIRNPSLSTSVVKEAEIALSSLYNIQYASPRECTS